MVGVDLFSGAGGLSVGALAAGIHIRIAVDSDRHAASTYKVNHPGVVFVESPIESIRSIDSWHLQEKPEELIVFGGPPCQGFSTSNQRTRSAENPTNWLFSEYLRLVRLVAPAWVVFENVKGILETEGAYFLDRVHSGLRRLGYSVTVWLLNASNYGVPQTRYRVFVIGSRDGVKVREPLPNCKGAISVREAIADLPILRNGAARPVLPYRTAAASPFARRMRGRRTECGNHLVTDSQPHIIARYKSVPRGGNWQDIPCTLMHNYSDRERCHTGIYRRLKWEEPSVVIGNFRKNMLIHPSQNRGLSVREAARLQSFPDNFIFQGSIGFQQQQVGNAVPPLLAEAVFSAIVGAV